MTDAPLEPATRRTLRCAYPALAFGVGFASIVCALYALGHSRYESPQVRSDRKNLARMQTGTGVVFGSSHGFNLLPEELGFEGANLSHGGQDAFEMIYMARAVKRSAPRLEIAIFTLSYFTFAFDNAAYVQRGTQSRVGRRIGMYSAFPSLGFVPGDGSSYVKGLLYPVVTRDHWKSLLWPDESDRAVYTKASDLPPNPKTDKHVASERELATHARRRCSQYRKLTRNMTSNHEDLDNDVYVALRDVSRELEGAGIRVVLLTPAYFDTYNACFNARQQASMRRLAKRLANQTGAEYIDAGRAPEFASKREFFRNSDHMNGAGKVEFSRWLSRQLARREKR
jgi:hypothetical protein